MFGTTKMFVISFLLLIVGGFVNTASAFEKLTFENQVVVEHAEIILPSEGSKFARAYMVIWNGTGTTVSVVTIEGQSGEVQLVRNKTGNDGQFDINPSSMPRLIPPHSEFIMTKNGYFLMVPVDDLAVDTQGYLLSVELESGRKIVAIADVLAVGTEPLHHHHGSEDN